METKSFVETGTVAGDFVKNLIPHKERATVVGLTGDLGSGKTTFVKGAAKALGIGNTVTSPTFVIEKIYKTENMPFEHVVHIDAYRLDGGGELSTLGWDDVLANPKTLVFVEWPERVADVLPENTETIQFTFIDENTRRIEFPDGYKI